MPTVELNKLHWGKEYAWGEQGDEWSKEWGGPESQWFGALLPRIHSFLPAERILEIAPGFGRWTQYLKDHCNQLILVDLNENCIEECKKRFSKDTNISYYTNDGKSLSMIPDGSVDFVFSFDSLVHAEVEVLKAYIAELARILSRDGVAFLHHSNIGEYRFRWRVKDKIPTRLRKLLTKKRILNYYHWRAFSVTAKGVADICSSFQMQCRSQELVNWHGRLLIDAFSVIARPESTRTWDNVVYRNRNFMKEAQSIKRCARLYRHYSTNSENPESAIGLLA
jgi:ubiquinone/menaquinone biosynthesis C-methylase UbiE